MSGPIRRPQLADEVATHLRALIMSGRLRPGERVRLEEVAEQLGVSITPVREALLTLRGEDMVELEPRKGYVVAPLSKQDIVDVFTVQGDIAGELAARAAVRLTAEHLAELSTVDRKLARTRKPEDLEPLEFEFHRTINRLAGARKLSWLLHAATRYTPGRLLSSDPGWRATMPGAVVPTTLSAMLTPSRAVRRMIGCAAAAGWWVTWTITPCASVSSTRQSVPASELSMPTSSPCAAASRSWLRASVACRRLGVTASNAIVRRVSAWLRAQRIQDWITASPTSPEGRTPSSKNWVRASATRSAGVLANSCRGPPARLRGERGTGASRAGKEARICSAMEQSGSREFPRMNKGPGRPILRLTTTETRR